MFDFIYIPTFELRCQSFWTVISIFWRSKTEGWRSSWRYTKIFPHFPAGWWFGTWLVFSHSVGDNHRNWRSYVSGVLKPPTSIWIWLKWHFSHIFPHKILDFGGTSLDRGSRGPQFLGFSRSKLEVTDQAIALSDTEVAEAARHGWWSFSDFFRFYIPRKMRKWYTLWSFNTAMEN